MALLCRVYNVLVAQVKEKTINQNHQNHERGKAGWKGRLMPRSDARDPCSVPSPWSTGRSASVSPEATPNERAA